VFLSRVKGIHVSGTSYVELGAAIRLACNVSVGPVTDSYDEAFGTDVIPPPIDANWYRATGSSTTAIRSSPRSGITVSKKVDVHRDGHMVDSQLQYLIVMLDIETSRAEHVGEYVCRSTNGLAESATVNLHYGRRFHSRMYQMCLRIAKPTSQNWLYL